MVQEIKLNFLSIGMYKNKLLNKQQIISVCK